MTPNAKDIFADSLEMTPGAREAYLERACAGNVRLLEEVRALLRAHPGESGFLSAPTVKQGVGTVGTLDAEEQPGAVIGRYKLLQAIGEGGFGRVYMAEQREPVMRKVALKLIKLGMDTRQVVARFEAERQALAMMDHPNIARVLDGGATNAGRPYFVMELVRGDPITQYCDTHNQSTRERLELFKQVCMAVQHAHQKGIIHRDLKPSNVLVTMVDGKPVPKVIDFGIAKATNSRLTEKTVFTEFRQLIGTPEYMSPEQAEMSGVDIDTRSDVYSLGVLLYELLTGSTPFEGRKLRSAAWGELQRIIREEEPPKPSHRLSTMRETIGSVASHRSTEPARLVGLVRGELDWIVMKCLEKDRTRRYDAASALSTDIDRYLMGAPVSAAPASTSYRVRKFVRRNRAAVVTGAALTLALVGGIAGTTIGLLRTQTQRDRAVLAEREKGESLALAEQREREAKAEAERADREAESARQSAAIARSANRFITDVISKANRGAQKGNPDVKVREVLDTAAAELDKHPEAYEPEVREATLDVIGQTYSALGLYDLAERPIRESIELTKKRLTPGDPDIPVAMSQLVSMLQAAGRYAEAEREGREALRLAIAAKGDQDPLAAQAMVNLAGVLPDRGQLGESINLAEAATRIFEKDPKKHAKALTASLNALAVSLSKRGNVDRAIEAHQRAIDTSIGLEKERLGTLGGAEGPQTPELATALNSLGMAYFTKQDYAEAEKHVLQGLEMRRKLLGPDHPDVAISLNNLGGIAQGAGRMEDAERYLTEALELRRRVLGDDAAVTIGSVENLANLHQDKGELVEAERLYRKVLASYERTLGTRDVQISETKSNLATLVAQKGDLDGAISLLQEALEIRREISGNEHPLTALCLSNLAAVQFRRGDVADAIRGTREALVIERAIAPDGLTVASSLGNLGIGLHALGEFGEAEATLREAIEMNLRYQPEGSSRSRAGQLTLAWTLAEVAWQGRAKPDEALRAKAAEGEQIMRTMIVERLKTQPEDAPNLNNPRIVLANAIVSVEANRVANGAEGGAAERLVRLREAEGFLKTAMERLAGLPEAQRATVQRRGSPRGEPILARLYTLWNEMEPGAGKDALAKEWEEKAKGIK